MIEMSPAYAHESKVGPVFDITSWSPSKSIWMGLVGLVFAAVLLATATFLWHPKIMAGKMPPGTENVIGDAIKAHRTHRWAMRGSIAVTGALGCLFGAAAIAGLRDGFSGGYYFRAGTDGLSLRLPRGLSWQHGGLRSAALELDLPWDEIEGLTVTQVKQLGSLSRNAGNVSADLKIVMRTGQKHTISLDGLEAAAYLIHERLNEARQMVSADVGQRQPQDACV
ncbi:MAG: hypothetical protein ACYC3X_08895 [Pirellulaceae bacterium]